MNYKEKLAIATLGTQEQLRLSRLTLLKFVGPKQAARLRGIKRISSLEFMKQLRQTVRKVTREVLDEKAEYDKMMLSTQQEEGKTK